MNLEKLVNRESKVYKELPDWEKNRVQDLALARLFTGGVLNRFKTGFSRPSGLSYASMVSIAILKTYHGILSCIERHGEQVSPEFSGDEIARVLVKNGVYYTKSEALRDMNKITKKTFFVPEGDFFDWVEKDKKYHLVRAGSGYEFM